MVHGNAFEILCVRLGVVGFVCSLLILPVVSTAHMWLAAGLEDDVMAVEAPAVMPEVWASLQWGTKISCWPSSPNHSIWASGGVYRVCAPVLCVWSHVCWMWISPTTRRKNQQLVTPAECNQNPECKPSWTSMTTICEFTNYWFTVQNIKKHLVQKHLY